MDRIKRDEILRASELLENEQMDRESILSSIQSLLQAFGENPERDGLKRTPERVANMFSELLEGYRIDPEGLINDALFDVDYQDVVIVKDIEFYSMCEHHLLPFIGTAHVAYIPNGKIIGLSKIPRVVDMFARRLQVQERMTAQIATFLDTVLHPQGVAVAVDGIHLCAMIRGVKKHDVEMNTSKMLGKYETNIELREEFFKRIQTHISIATLGKKYKQSL
jgi:GTP cyclohydrolase IA